MIIVRSKRMQQRGKKHLHKMRIDGIEGKNENLKVSIYLQHF